jgi:hypothetical protein
VPIGIELPLVYNFTANEDDIGRHVGTALANRRISTLHQHAEIFVGLAVFAGLDVRVAVEPLDRLLKWRELGYHNSLDALILIRVEHLEWSVPYEHIDILGVDRWRDLPIALEPRSVLHRLANINKIARHSMHLVTSLIHRSALGVRAIAVHMAPPAVSSCQEISPPPFSSLN